MAKNPPPQPPQHPAHSRQLADLRSMVWPRLLPLHGLALASEGSPRPNRSTQQLPYLSPLRLDGHRHHRCYRRTTRRVLPRLRPRYIGRPEPQGLHREEKGRGRFLAIPAYLSTFGGVAGFFVYRRDSHIGG